MLYYFLNEEQDKNPSNANVVFTTHGLYKSRLQKSRSNLELNEVKIGQPG